MRPAPSVIALALAALCFTAAAAAAPIKPGTLLHYDLTRFEDTAPAALRDASGWRRARLSLSATLPGGGDAKIEHDFSSDTFTDVYLRFPVAGGRLWLGQFKQPFSADALLSDAQHFTTESAVVGAFAPGRRLGLQYARGGLAASVYGRDLHDAGPDLGIAGRWFGSRGNVDSGLWHYGGAVAWEKPPDDRVRIGLRPDVGPRSGSWVSSGALATDDLQRLGLEGGYQHGRLLLLGELLQLRLDDAPGGRTRHADGGYITAAWTLRGSPRGYSNGLFTLPKGVAGIGQVELVARYADVSLPRASAGSIGQQGLSLGLNAQIGRHGRLLLDRHASERSTDGADAALWTLRLQFAM
jgi:phosphate-selective porin OprO and OprP